METHTALSQKTRHQQNLRGTASGLTKHEPGRRHEPQNQGGRNLIDATAQKTFMVMHPPMIDASGTENESPGKPRTSLSEIMPAGATQDGQPMAIRCARPLSSTSPDKLYKSELRVKHGTVCRLFLWLLVCIAQAYVCQCWMS